MNENLDEIICTNKVYKDSKVMKALLQNIKNISTKTWNIMEVCGGQTNTIVRYGLEELLDPCVRMIHGPGCPVCVTPQSIIDDAIEIAENPNVVFCSFGDMLRVPGTDKSLLRVKSEGADVRILYSPLDIIKMAKSEPDKEFVFFAIGFETTMPIYALLIKNLEKLNIKNVSLLTSLFTVPSVIRMIANDSDCHIDALLAAGHVCAIMGISEYENLSEELRIPIVIIGFEPVDILEGIFNAVKQLENRTHKVDNPYKRVVQSAGNIKAQEDIKEIFVPSEVEWRGIGNIVNSGMQIAKKYEHYNAKLRFSLKGTKGNNTTKCISGSIMKGLQIPINCSCFGKECTPEHPVGAPMVSSEGICAAFYANKKI